MIKRSEKTILSFKSSGHSVRLIQVHDYRPFDRYQIITNRRIQLTTLTYEYARRMFVREVTLYVSQLNLFENG